MEFQSSEMWTIPGWVHVGVTCQSNIHIPHIVTRSLHLLWFSRHCRSVAHDERAALAHQCSECCTSLHVCQRGSEKGINTCSGPNVLEQRRQKQDVISEISHTLLCSTVLLLVLLAARWWTFGVSTRVLGFFWDSYNSCFRFGFFMVWIWNVVFLPSIPGLFLSHLSWIQLYLPWLHVCVRLIPPSVLWFPGALAVSSRISLPFLFMDTDFLDFA